MPDDAPRRSRRWILIGIGVALFLVAGGLTAFMATRGGDVSNPDVEFRPEPTATPVEEQRPVQEGERDDFVWPQYGFSKNRRRYLPAPKSLRPPFRRIWSLTGSVLLEFPPILVGPRLFLLKNNGALYAASKRTGKVLWKKKLGYLAAASPAYSEGRVYAVLLQRGRTTKAGRIVALDVRRGKILWSRLLPSRSESSPVIDGGSLYFGSENGTIYALRTTDGSVQWTSKVAGAVKSGLALDGGKLYFGDYAGRVHALRQGDGSRVWSTGTSGARFGLSSGNFYSTPAVAYGRVYLGSTDGRIYSFSSLNGKLAWAKRTGGFVYASPAVAELDRGRPTVYAGSYDKKFYALDARNGKVRWSHNVGGRVSGGATIIGDVVYFSELDGKRTVGLGARTGRKVFDFGRGAYNPVVSDRRTIFLTGYSSLYAFRPLTAEGRVRVAKRAKEARKSRAATRRQTRTRDARLQSGCRSRAERLHSRRGAVVRSFRDCVRRERAAATRGACRRRAQAAHDRRSRYLRSLRACIRRNGGRLPASFAGFRR